jgi:hypothetical protein
MVKALAPTVVAALLLLASGCAQKAQDSVQIVGLCSLPDDCAFPSGGCDTFDLARPVVDVSAATSLQLVLDVRNQLSTNGGGDEGSTNTHDAQITEAAMSYSSLTAGFSLGGSSMHPVAHVPAEGEATAFVYVIPEEAMVRLKALGVPAFDGTNYVDMVANVKLKGTFQDGSTFETGEYEQPFRVCNGCIVPCAAGVACPPDAEGQSPAICVQ